MSDDQAEIIARPPSHPVATTLIIVSMLATIFSIGLVWDELFSEYLPSPGPGQQVDIKHDSRKIAEKGIKDHYKVDFPAADVMADIESELGISSVPGGDSGLDSGG